MGDEHGRRVLSPISVCEEPSAAAGMDSSRPAAACRRGDADGSGAPYGAIDSILTRK
jgi:hypothetical protein